VPSSTLPLSAPNVFLVVVFGHIAENDGNIQNLIKEGVPDVSIVGRKHSEFGETLARTHHQMTVFSPYAVCTVS